MLHDVFAPAALDAAKRAYKKAPYEVAMAEALNAYFVNVWRRIDDRAKSGELVLLRRGAAFLSARWLGSRHADTPWYAEAAGKWLPEDWPDAYAPVSALGDFST